MVPPVTLRSRTRRGWIRECACLTCFMFIRWVAKQYLPLSMMKESCWKVFVERRHRTQWRPHDTGTQKHLGFTMLWSKQRKTFSNPICQMQKMMKVLHGAAKVIFILYLPDKSRRSFLQRLPLQRLIELLLADKFKPFAVFFCLCFVF